MSFDRNQPLTEESERRLAKQIQGFFPSFLFQEGFGLFQNGHVSRGEWTGADRFSSEIADGKECFKVQVQLGFLPYSRCGCIVKGSCAHMAAVICEALFSCDIKVFEFVRKYKLASVSDKPSTDSMEHSQPKPALLEPVAASKATSIPKPPTAVAPSFQLSAQTLQESDQEAIPAPHDGYRKWHRTFEKRMPGYDKPIENFSKWVEHDLFRVAEPWEDEDRKSIYRMHAILYALQLVGRVSSKRSYYYWNSNQGIQPLLNDFAETGEKIPSLAGNEREELSPALEGLAAMCSQYAMASESSLVDWIGLYRYVWGRFSTRQSVRAELEKLTGKMAQREGVHTQNEIMLVCAIVHLHVMNLDAEAAIDIVQNYCDGSPTRFYHYIEAYMSAGNWPAALMWLKGLQPVAARYAVEPEIQQLMKWWHQYAKKSIPYHRQAEETVQYVKGLLPAALEDYSALLLSHRDYRGWVDLHLAYDTEIPGFIQEYAIVEKKAADLLLPFHHVCAVKWIETRKRNGYEEAVGHMRRLKKLYGKLKRNEAYQHYIDAIMRKYAKLKALHEAMSRGGVLPS